MTGGLTEGAVVAAISTDTDFLDALRQAESREALFDCLDARLRGFGIGGFGYGFTAMRTSRGAGADLLEMHFHQTYPKDWQAAIGDEDTRDHDATTILLFQGRQEVDWTTLRPDAERLGPEVLRNHEMAQDFGIRNGIGLRLDQDAGGRMLSGVGLWFSDPPDAAAFHADWTRHRDEIKHVLHLFDTTVRHDRAPLLVGLSDRERDALSYLAAGYRSAEASWAMRISEKTFEKHVARAKDKLNARTRDHAVAKALVMRLIEP